MIPPESLEVSGMEDEREIKKRETAENKARTLNDVENKQAADAVEADEEAEEDTPRG